MSGAQTSPLVVTHAWLSPAPLADRQRGLLGFVACTINDSLRVDGLTLRQTVTGTLTLSYPARESRSWRKHFYVRPLDDRARREIELQIFQLLGFTGNPGRAHVHVPEGEQR